MGKPKTGFVQQIKTSTHFRYKRAVKAAFNEHDNCYNDELLNHLLLKDNVNFWKCWNSKMHCNITKEVYIDGNNDELYVANVFGNYFNEVYSNSSSVHEAVNDYNAALQFIQHDSLNMSDINVEHADAAIHSSIVIIEFLKRRDE